MCTMPIYLFNAFHIAHVSPNATYLYPLMCTMPAHPISSPVSSTIDATCRCVGVCKPVRSYMSHASAPLFSTIKTTNTINTFGIQLAPTCHVLDTFSTNAYQRVLYRCLAFPQHLVSDTSVSNASVDTFRHSSNVSAPTCPSCPDTFHVPSTPGTQHVRR